MCGRYVVTTPAEVPRTLFGLAEAEPIRPRWNVAPAQPVPVITNRLPRRLEMFRRGLIPSWAKAPSIGNRMINARAETLAGKPSFRDALRRRRCVVLSDGFYEWREGPKPKTPMHIRLRGGGTMAFAGLFDTWRSPDGEVIDSCAIVTTDANALMAPFHHRMPVILAPGAREAWLAPGAVEPEEVRPLLVPFPPEAMEAFAVSRKVNSPALDDPACAEPSPPGE